MTKIFESIAEWCEFRKNLSAGNASIGFVPTMGNLHFGHQSLLTRAVQENDISVLSIFVNPTQFENNDELKKYPKTVAEDLKIAEELGVDYILLPNYSELYADGYSYLVTENKLSTVLDGATRDGHFDGVLTVVLKLLMLIKATNVYLGEKDYQQLQLIAGMVKAFFVDTEVIFCPTVRDKNGLALSSRNSRLSEGQYKLAIKFPELLVSKKTCAEIKNELEELQITVDYIEERSGRRFGAVKIGEVRLIDNIIVI